jgi:hypothetical protein
MGITADRKFDWIAALAVILGAAVVLPSMVAVGTSVITIIVQRL